MPDDRFTVHKYGAYVPVTEEMLCDIGQCKSHMHPEWVPVRKPWRSRFAIRTYRLRRWVASRIYDFSAWEHDDCY